MCADADGLQRTEERANTNEKRDNVSAETGNRTGREFNRRLRNPMIRIRSGNECYLMFRNHGSPSKGETHRPGEGMCRDEARYALLPLQCPRLTGMIQVWPDCAPRPGSEWMGLGGHWPASNRHRPIFAHVDPMLYQFCHHFQPCRTLSQTIFISSACQS